MRRTAWEAGGLLLAALLLPWCHAGRTLDVPPVPTTTTVRTAHSAPDGVICRVGGYRVVTDPISARHLNQCERTNHVPIDQP